MIPNYKLIRFYYVIINICLYQIKLNVSLYYSYYYININGYN